VRNIGPGNPVWHLGIDRLRLEIFVRHIYVDIPENYSQKKFYGNLATILPLLTNLHSLYIVMRRWDNHIWEIELGKFLPDHAPPSLKRLSIQVSNYCNLKQYRIHNYSRFHRVTQMLCCSHASDVLSNWWIGLVHGTT
jgi:hypothetical protein